MRTVVITVYFLLQHVIRHVITLSLRSTEARFELTNDYALLNHVIDTIQSVEGLECARLCTHRSQCFSANYNSIGRICELNAKRRKKEESLDFVETHGSIYMEKMECEPNVCLNGGLCSPKYQPAGDSFRCICPRGFIGQFCQTAIAGYRRTFPANSCKQIYDEFNSSRSGVYFLRNVTNSVSAVYKAYCIMDEIDGCGGGGWSLVMKINGNKVYRLYGDDPLNRTTFSYNSSYWENKQDYDEGAAGQTGLDTMESKMPFYWSTPFTQLCLGMKIENVTRWIKIEYSASSLYEVISKGNFHSFNSVPVSQWRSLLPQSSMQSGFTRSGFNNRPDKTFLPNSRARIGLLGNNESDMNTPDSRIGFGMAGSGSDEDQTNSCGNEAASNLGADNGKMSIKAFCYILIH